MTISEMNSNASTAYKHLPSEDNGNFIYTFAHEIRNPLTNINLATEVLEHMVTDNGAKMYLSVIMRNSGRIKDMLTDLFASGRTHEWNPEKQSVHSLFDEILATNNDRAILKRVAIRKNYTARDFRIKINRAEVKTALTNIIINAIEAMPAKNGLLEITTKLLHGIYFLIIKDNGSGISKIDQENIFKPYFTTKPGGVGLGLSNTLSILNSNHIEVNLRSEPGKGTRFILFHKRSFQQ